MYVYTMYTIHFLHLILQCIRFTQDTQHTHFIHWTQYIYYIPCIHYYIHCMLYIHTLYTQYMNYTIPIYMEFIDLIYTILYTPYTLPYVPPWPAPHPQDGGADVASVGVQDCEVISWGELCARSLPAGKCFQLQCLGWMCSSSFILVETLFVWFSDAWMNEKLIYPTMVHQYNNPPCPKLRVTILKRSGARGPAMLFQAAGCKGQHRALRGWAALVAIRWRCKRQELCRSRGFSARFGLARDRRNKKNVWWYIWWVVWFQCKASQVNPTIWRSDEVPGVFSNLALLEFFCQTLEGPFWIFRPTVPFHRFSNISFTNPEFPKKALKTLDECRITTHFSQDSSGWRVVNFGASKLAVRVLVCWMWWMIYDGDDLVVVVE